jgi:uncharacterized protein
LGALKKTRRPRVKHPRTLAVALLVVVGASLVFAMLAPRHSWKSPRSSLPRPAATHAAQAPADPAAIAAKSVETSKPVKEAALRPPPRAAVAEPAWLRYAAPAPPSGHRSLVAVVIDDLGLDRVRTAAVIGLPGALTLSFMTYASELAQQTEAAREAGHELFLHVPMEAFGARADAGPHGLLTSQSRDQILDRLRWDLGRFDGFVGINNHMGSKFTSDERSMTPVMEELRTRGLVFLDSRTSPASAGIRLAIAYGVPHAARDVFLDDDQAPAAIAKQLARLEQIAQQHGSAIAIGHPRDTTIAALRAWLPLIEGKGLALVPVSAVVRSHMAADAESQN